MANLGRLALRKRAAETGAPGFFDRLGQLSQAEQQAGQYATRSAVGPTASQVAGHTTGQQALIGGIHSTLGPAGVGAAMVGLPYIQRAAGAMGLDLQEPWQLGYGGSPRAAREQARVSGQLMANQIAGMGESGSRLIDMLGQQAARAGLPKQVQETLSWAAQADPQTLGMIIQQVGAQFPQLQVIMSRLDPSFVTDYSPLVQATYYQNNGEFDEQLFQQNLSQFNRAYRSGAFGDVPAQVAMHSVAFASEQGMSGGAALRAAQNVSRAAHSFIDRGLADNFGAAMQLAQSVSPNVLQDPSGAMRFAVQMDHLARRGHINRQELAQAAQVAAQQGLDPSATMQAMAMSSRVRRATNSEEAASTAANALSQFQTSHRAQVMGTLYQTNAQARRMIDQGIQTGDAELLDRVYDRFGNSPQLQQTLDPSAGSRFAAMVTQTNPDLLGRVVMTEAMDAAEGNPELRNLLGDRDRLIETIRTGDLTRFSRATQRALMRNRGMLGATALATMRRPDEGLPAPVGTGDEPARRIGLQYPSRPGRPLGSRPQTLTPNTQPLDALATTPQGSGPLPPALRPARA